MDLSPLPREFFLPAPDIVAPALLGKRLLRRRAGQLLLGRIVETEAYFGAGDPAAHAFAGRTARNGVLWGPPGHAYVYFIYGLHACLNVSCEPDGIAGCVLLRALEPLAGADAMAVLRGSAPDRHPRLLTSGPGRLCQALGITREAMNGADLLDPLGELVLLDSEPGFERAGVTTTPRIGITKAADRPLRFVLRGNPYVSGPKGRA